MSDVNHETVAPRAPLHQFTVPLSATRRGARLARLLAAEQLDAWGLPPDPARLIVANSPRTPSCTAASPAGASDSSSPSARPGCCASKWPTPGGEKAPARGSASPAPVEPGYGLLLVEELADHWGVLPGPFPCKTVWAELEIGRFR